MARQKRIKLAYMNTGWVRVVAALFALCDFTIWPHDRDFTKSP